MKTLGLIGGTSWVSTMEYYKLINQQINQRLGGLNSGRLILYSVNYEELKPPADPTEWKNTKETLSSIAKKLEAAGAECVVLCANTLHMAAENIEQHISIPIIHIAEETAKKIAKQNISKVGLMGTRITMEQPFYRDKLLKYGITTIVPEAEDRHYIHSTIFNELAKGMFSEELKNRYLQIIQSLIEEGAEGIILGCTEIPMLIQPGDSGVPTFDTTLIHATAAIKFALELEEV